MIIHGTHLTTSILHVKHGGVKFVLAISIYSNESSDRCLYYLHMDNFYHFPPFDNTESRKELANLVLFYISSLNRIIKFTDNKNNIYVQIYIFDTDSMFSCGIFSLHGQKIIQWDR